MSYDIKTLVIVGSAQCGKTSIFNAMYRGYFKHKGFVQGSYFTLNLNSAPNEPPVNMTIFDTSSLESLFDIRRITYLTANVIVLTFGIDSKESLRDLEQKWHPEVKYFCPEDVAVIVVGNKRDLRRDPDDIGTISYSEGLAVAKKLKARAYLECSALTGEGIVDIFTCAAKATNTSTVKTTRRCDII
uniref:GTPase rho n=1 Tax=Riptortus pedestris TaxID=329032 RepID=R4WPU2_RIPPE|nr:GTPase rho [Riptortus pedestris]